LRLKRWRHEKVGPDTVGRTGLKEESEGVAQLSLRLYS
jgi:hypothetical protein